MKVRHLLARLRRDATGATLAEFALILPALCVVLMGAFEAGWRIYVSSVVSGTLHDAARLATVGGVSNAQIDTMVKARLHQFSHRATVTTSTRSYDDFNQVSVPEVITSDTAPVGTYNIGDCYEDYNQNGDYDLDRGRTGMGNADDIVRYEVSISYPRVFPVPAFLGWSETDSVSAHTVLRNQPYAGRSISTPPVVCD